MSTAQSNDPASRRPSMSRWWSFATPTVRSMVVTWVVIIGVAYLLHSTVGNRNDAFHMRPMSPPQSAGALEQRIRSGDPSAMTDFDIVRKQVEELHQAMGTKEKQFRRLLASTDEETSRNAVAQAKTAALQAEVAAARTRLEKIKSLHARWTARSASLLSGEPGRRIVGSPPHLTLVIEILNRERPTDADIQRCDVQLDLLGGPLQSVPADQRGEISLSTEHAKMLRELGEQFSTWLASYDQQNLLLEAILTETATSEPGKVTLAATLREHRIHAEEDLSKRLTQARGEARQRAEAALAERIGKLEEELVAAEGKAREDALRTKKLQVELDQARNVAGSARNGVSARPLPQPRWMQPSLPNASESSQR